MENKLYVIAGHNGAGKTTFLEEFVKRENLKYINVDEIAKSISVDSFSLLSIKTGKIALKRIQEFNLDSANCFVYI